jgi:hypothetical protein
MLVANVPVVGKCSPKIAFLLCNLDTLIVRTIIDQMRLSIILLAFIGTCVAFTPKAKIVPSKSVRFS